MTLIDTLVIAMLGVNELGAIGAMGVVIDIMDMFIKSLNISNIAFNFKGKKVKMMMKERIKFKTGNSVIASIYYFNYNNIYYYNSETIHQINIQCRYKICITYITIRLIGFIQNSIVTILSGHQRAIGKQEI